MKTKGRRMQGKQVVLSNAKSMDKLDEMNLGQAQVLTAEEEFEFRCYDGNGERLKNIFVAPQLNRMCVLHKSNSSLANTIMNFLDVEQAQGKCKVSVKKQNALELQAEICHRERVARDRAYIERVEFEYRSGRNPGQRAEADASGFFFGFDNDSERIARVAQESKKKI